MNIAGFSWEKRKDGEDAAGARVFTEHVRVLERGGEPEPQRLAVVREALKGALRGELRRRGLWNAPPDYLGVYGAEGWEDALEELASAVYVFIFVDRRRALQAQLRLKPNVDGLVFLNVRHFLHERQKEHDPLGSQVFEVLQSAVRRAVASGELHVLAGDPRVRNETVLGFRPDAEPAPPVRDFRELVARWNDGLLPDLVTLRGRRQEEIVERLRERLADLSAGGDAFRFKDVIDPLRADVRARWGALLENAAGETAVEWEDGEGVRVVRLSRPDTGFEERQLFRKLISCVLTAIERLEVNEKTRAYLATLWQFLRVNAGSGPAEAGEGGLSLRRIAELLGIPRERLPGLYETLGQLVERCRAANSGKLSVTSLPGAFAPAGPRGITP
ncbi:MAG TPA: hypothetical protein VLX28_07300 [Thermoanaerobaculia bacterium]|nr:hypothetical protein [Thermoanaerobaculia bacterium]